jgi:hypothetical protein
VSSESLTLHELARLLKAMTDRAYANPQIGEVSRLLKTVARELDLELTSEQVGQVYDALSLVVPAGAVYGTEFSVELDRAIAVTSRDDARDALSKTMFRAWRNVHAAARQEPTELVLRETGGLLVPDPRDRDLDGLSIAELVFLVAHDKLDGRALLAQPVLACAVASALLAELLLRGLIRVDLVSHLVQTKANAKAEPSATGISAPVHEAFEEILVGRAVTLARWLTILSAKGCPAVCGRLLEAGVVVREERGRLIRKTYFVPTGEVVDSIFRVVTSPLHVGRMPTAPCAVVIELAKATRLTVARFGEWIHVHDIDPGGTLTDAPSREQLDLLLALTRAEVTALLSRP